MRPHRPEQGTSLIALARAAILAVVLAGCSDAVGLGDSSGIVGSFVLVDVGGEPLPVRSSIEGIPDARGDTLLIDRTADFLFEDLRLVRAGGSNGLTP